MENINLASLTPKFHLPTRIHHNSTQPFPISRKHHSQPQRPSREFPAPFTNASQPNQILTTKVLKATAFSQAISSYRSYLLLIHDE